jgi:hypothetical protein
MIKGATHSRDGPIPSRIYLGFGANAITVTG